MSSDGIPVRVVDDRLRQPRDPLAEGMPASEVTIAEILSDAGYRTALFGKWHLGAAPGLQPLAQGFDTWAGFLGGAALYVPPGDPTVVSAQLDIDRQLWDLLPYRFQRDGGPLETSAYQTDLWTDLALNFIDQRDERPFFIMLAQHAPHNPLQALRSDHDRIQHIDDETTRIYAAMLYRLDLNVGRLIDTLQSRGLDDNTIILFASDNGGANYTEIWTHNYPYRGFKGSFWEGGIRTPLFVRWPNGIRAGAKVDQPVSLLDVAPTLVALSGSAPPADWAVDGRNLFDRNGNPARQTPRTLYWRAGDNSAILEKGWKLIVSGNGASERTWLYHLRKDPEERRNLATDEPTRVAQLKSNLRQHYAGMPPTGPWPAIELPIRADPPSPNEASQSLNELDWVYWPG